MSENENIQPENPKPARRSAVRRRVSSARPLAVESEPAATRIRKGTARPSRAKPERTQSKRWQKISIGVIILCLCLIGGIIFTLTRYTTPPLIKNVSFSDINEKTASVTWDTDELTTSQVKICASDVCTSTVPVTSFVLSHSASLGDLKPNTRYHFTLMSKDKGGSMATLDVELTTPAQPYSAPVLISDLTAFNITSSSATVTWLTDKPTKGQVDYGETDAYGSTTPADQNLVTSHSFKLAELKPGTTYYFKVSLQDANGNEVTSEGKTFTTLSGQSANIEIGPQVGKRAPDFTLTDLDGKETSLSQFRGKMVVLNFWDTSCTACVEETPFLQGVFNKWSGDDLAVLTVSVNQRAPFVQSFVQRRGLTFPVLVDADGAVSRTYQISSFPSTFFINSEGVIKSLKDDRFTTQAELEDMIKSL